MFLAEVVVN